MQSTHYKKLVRDKIPEIIEASGKTCSWEVLLDDEYVKKLNEKLLEEVNEYIETGSIEELADINEVIKAILEHKGISEEEVEELRLKKLEIRGGFKKRIVLKRVDG